MLKTGAASCCILLTYLLLLTSCGSAIAPSPKQELETIPTLSTPAPSIPTMGEWMAPAPTANVTFVLTWQIANSSTIVSSLTTLSYICESSTDYSSDIPLTTVSTKINTWTSPANVTINGNAVYLSAYVQYVSPLNTWHYFYMTFAGEINNDGSLALVSSDISGVQDYQFTPSSNGIQTTQNLYKQACS